MKNATMLAGEKLAYSIQDFANLTGLSKSFLRLEISRKHLRVIHVGNGRGRVVILKEEAKRYLSGTGN
jgi:hypothetical protein